MDLNNNRFNFRSSQESLFGCSSQDSVSSSFLGSPTSAETQDTNYSSGYSGGGGGGDGYIDDVFDVSLLKSSSQSTTDSIISIGDGKDIDGNGNGNGDYHDRTQTRRLKNRESAARSRQKIKNRLQILEIQQKQLLNRKHAIENEKSVAIKEVDRLESSMLNLKITQITNSLVKKEIIDGNHQLNLQQQQQQQQTSITFNSLNNLGNALIKTEESSSILQP
ncbi:hypothetical protein DERP_003601 [Dermatophagoides pteronyssinus]|uniref:BZIP domain-containing protein n=1 Tax=Dermatophagoides pteronyssinus TaxID=6956 RepID=A0ABQ8JL36_DERPT|nr:hypothetical protein DERP_003601 [Dermatophagoides pteronyssinus]